MSKLLQSLGKLFIKNKIFNLESAMNCSNIEGPLVVVCGCTGTGKSDLGVEIARTFNGEVISADSMQIFRGLDIANNKVTLDEMKGMPHHMMGFYDPRLSNYNVHNFRDDCLALMQRIWRDGKLPVIVGGTAYYIEAILYHQNLIDTDVEKSERIRQDLLKSFPTNDSLYEELRRLDPDSAKLVHRNNRFRVLRALEIFHSTGKKKSDYLREQKIQKIEESTRSHLGKLRFMRTFLLNLDADKEVLNNRLDKRIDKMLKRGLLKELEDFYKEYKNSLGSFGIMQTIGLKEFLPYLQLSAEEKESSKGKKIFEQSCDMMKVHTRQYCRSQRNWLYQRIFLRAKTREIPEFISLNTSVDFEDRVVPFALECVKHFIDGNVPVSPALENNPLIMPLPERPNALHLEDPEYDEKASLVMHCEFCDIEIHGHLQWKGHLEGKRHRMMKKAVQQKQMDDGVKNEMDGIVKNMVN